MLKFKILLLTLGITSMLGSCKKKDCRAADKLRRDVTTIKKEMQLWSPEIKAELAYYRRMSKRCIISIDEDGEKIWMKGYSRYCMDMRPEQVECIQQWDVRPIEWGEEP